MKSNILVQSLASTASAISYLDINLLIETNDASQCITLSEHSSSLK
jgi:hypothetical protein